MLDFITLTDGYKLDHRRQYPPGPDRWKERSRTYDGIAKAMAAQWGGLSGNKPPQCFSTEGDERR